MSLSRQPSAPNHPYVPWQRKVRAQLDMLLGITNPDIHTKGLIRELQNRLSTPISRRPIKNANRRWGNQRRKRAEKP